MKRTSSYDAASGLLMPSLSARRIELTKPNPTKDIRIADGEGLYLKVTTGGTKSFTFRYTYAGRKRREITLGTFPEIGLAEAREKRLEQAKILQAGHDPLQVKQDDHRAKKEALTVEELIEDFHTNWLKIRFQQPDDAKAILKRHIGKPLGKVLAPDVTKQQVTQAVHAIVLRGNKVMANRVLTLARHMFDYAVDHHLIKESPVTMTRKAAGGQEPAKTVNLSLSQLALVIRVLRNPKVRLSWQTRIALLLTMATSKRPSEIVTMEWSHVDLEKAEWLNPKHLTKEQREDHLVFLSPYAVRLLREAWRVNGGGRFVFPGTQHPDRHLARHTLSHAILDLHLAGQIPFKFTPHDFRRTFSSRMADLGVLPHIVEKILDHLMEGVMAVYNRASYLPERRAAMDLWGAKLEELEPENQ